VRKKPLLTTALILAFLFSAVAGTQFVKTAKGKTIVVPDDYSSITIAIGYAHDGDVIFVKKGTYVENQININKQVSLLGENPENTTIQLAGTYTTIEFMGYRIIQKVYYGLNITANDVVISGFKIIPDSTIYQLTTNPTCISATSSHTQILDNIIEDAGAIRLAGSSQTVEKNNMVGTPVEIGGFQNMIFNNTITNSSIAVSGSLNTIYGNNISGKLTLWESNKTTIAKNDILGGITLTSSSNSTIENNNINEGSVSLQKCSIIIIESNNINEGDVTLKGSSSNIIKNNNITEGGIRIDTSTLDSVLEYSSDNVIRANRIVNGIGLSLVGTKTVDANLIENCSSGLTWPMTELVGAEMVSGTIYHNNFVGNAKQFTFLATAYGYSGCYYVDDSQEGNYWSDYNGTDANHDGIGDAPYVLQEGDEEQYVPFIIDRYPLMFPFDIENNAVVLPEPFPTLQVVAVSVAIVAVVAIGLLIYFKKRKH
jgi:nitrous oxidase accessory protein NosD